MQVKVALLGALVMSAVLAGCSSPPPSGTLVNANYQQPFEGGANVVYTPFSNGGNPIGTVPGGEDFECVQDAGAGTIPGESPVQPCTQPETTVAVNVTNLPPGATFTAFFAQGNGETKELKIGDLMEGATSATFAVDYTGTFGAIELRNGDFVYATAPAGSGMQAFAAPASFADIKVTGTFKGKDLSLTVSGLPANGTYTGKLYYPDESAPTGLDPKVSFPVQNGEVTYTLTDKTNVADYSEFHIHVGSTMINLYKAKITAS